MNTTAREFLPYATAQSKQVQLMQHHKQQLLAQQAGMTANQKAVLKAALSSPANLQAVLQNPNSHVIHHIQQQQLQQLQQLHQQNLRLAAAFQSNQMGMYRAPNILMNKMKPEPGKSRKTVADETNDDFEHFPTRDDVSEEEPIHSNNNQKRHKKPPKDSNKDSAFDDLSDESDDDESHTSAELEESEIPDAEVLEEICKQVEEYLSDDYLATDKYLLRQLRSKSEGYLSVKLLTSFKKIKKLTRDWRVTAFALNHSAEVELSPDGHRVKRRANLPENLRRGRTMTSILAIRVPDDWATLEAITNIFSAYGNITLARVLRPGRAIPPDLRNYATQIPDMGATTCAVVDFDSTDSAHECCRGLRDKNLRGMRIALLGPRIRRTLYKAEKKITKLPPPPKVAPPPKMSENRQTRRMKNAAAGMTKDHELKIIKHYFETQLTPFPNSKIDFPPLGGNKNKFGQFDQLPSQMQGMSLNQGRSKPTMSQIVAQNAREAARAAEREDVFCGEQNDFPHSDDSSESGHCSPKPEKSFKSWDLNNQKCKISEREKMKREESSDWCPWSTIKYNRDTEDDRSYSPTLESEDTDSKDFRFEPLPSLAIGQGIWSTSTNGKAGW